MAGDEVAELLSSYSQEVRDLALGVRALVREAVPDALEEFDASSGMVAFTFIPGTYRGAFVALIPYKGHVNLMFSKGVELAELDSSGLMEGTGKKARHITFRDGERLLEPEVRALIEAAAERTPRA